MRSCINIKLKTVASLAHPLEGTRGVTEDGLFDFLSKHAILRGSSEARNDAQCTLSNFYHNPPENEKFRSGAPPHSEIPHHLAVIEEIAGDVKRYHSELDRLRKVVWELESKRNTLQKRLDEHRNLVSVMRRLPVEL
ncbi:hypothetical protein VNI00_018423 [Paramarasmius palmivorus]|uniref:Uncharacterized protein n=1 Tax=Paramarasmius palmivorus TaxID=297713 RepID=A0AAW0AY59_9AGAR